MVFTYYFHLAAVPPRSIFRGARVKAGDVIGLVGDTGIKSASASASASSGSGSGTSVAAGRHLHFALSTQPSIAFPEMYWDLGPLMADWPLRVPAHGTVAGYAPPPKPEEPPPKRRSKKNVRAVSH
jgi:murein DD-endopeptidase MepM/ murein hydrolase activator NlpD